MSRLDELALLFATEGARDYLGERLTQSAHMLQAGELARRSGAADALVAAALLHDIGHFRGTGSGDDPAAGPDPTAERDIRHADRGARFLAECFGPAVTEPVRLHVAAKRYLCQAEPDYFSLLSEASRHTLLLQGGPMSEAEARAFEAEAYLTDALALRRWDEEAKDPSAPTPAFAEFRPLLERLSRHS